MEQLKILDLLDQIRIVKPSASTAMRLAEIAARRGCTFKTNSEEVIIAMSVTARSFDAEINKLKKVMSDLHYEAYSWPTNGWL